MPAITEDPNFLNHLPQKPGVYVMLDAEGRVIYVGKANNLKARVSSYFQRQLDAKTLHLVRNVHDIQITLTRTEREALFLENNLIKTHQPKYNILLKDDKSFPFLLLSTEAFPRLSFYRQHGNKKPAGKLYGPYASAGAVREALNKLQGIFQLRNCDKVFFKNRSRPCLQYHIKRCSAPCVGYISQEAYQQSVERAQQFLEGKDQELIKGLAQEMAQASKALDYERAALLRDQLTQLKHIQAAKGNLQRWLQTATEHVEQVLSQPIQGHTQIFKRFAALQAALDLPDMPQTIACFDVSHTFGEATVAACVVFRPLGADKAAYRHYTITDITPGDDYGAMREALTRHFAKQQGEDGVLPDILLIDGGRGQLKCAEEVFTALHITGVLLMGVAKGAARKAGDETLYLGSQAEPWVLPSHTPAFHLIQQIRDEAHRFAISRHRSKRAKRRLVSQMDSIPGVGVKRRQALLDHFGSIDEIQKASLEALSAVPGIRSRLAQAIYLALHPES